MGFLEAAQRPSACGMNSDQPFGRVTVEAETAYLKDLLGQIQASLK
jgi:hypothetical protein